MKIETLETPKHQTTSTPKGGSNLSSTLYSFFSTVGRGFSGQLSPWPTSELVLSATGIVANLEEMAPTVWLVQGFQEGLLFDH